MARAAGAWRLAVSLGWIDVAVVLAYFAATMAIGLWFGRGERDTQDFFLGGRRQHWLLAGISIIATEVSALTLIAVPADAFRSDWSYLQMYVGSFAGRIAIAFVLLPAFYGGSVTTVYEYLGQRFGPWTRITASFFFFASRILGSGIRLLVASLAIAQVFGWPLTWVIAASAGVAVLYATAGGIKAILWTDAFQAAIFTSAAAIAVGFLLFAIPGTWQENIAAAYHAGKLHTFNLDWSLSNDKAFWLLTMHAFFTTMAAMGTDQDLTQRMLTCSRLREGQRSLLFNAFAGLPIVCLFLTIGSLLFVYYAVHPAGAPAAREAGDRVFPHFIATALPHNVGMKGLMITAVFAAAMSSLSSAVGALATTAVTDLYKPATRGERSEAHYLTAARLFTFGFGAVLVIVAIAFSKEAELLWAVFKWTGLVFGGMLGIFLLGVLTKNRGRDGTNVAAMITSVAGLVVLKLYQDQTGHATIVWPWWIILGTAWTFVVASTLPTRPALTLGRHRVAHPAESGVGSR